MVVSVPSCFVSQISTLYPPPISCICLHLPICQTIPPIKQRNIGRTTLKGRRTSGRLVACMMAKTGLRRQHLRRVDQMAFLQISFLSNSIFFYSKVTC